MRFFHILSLASLALAIPAPAPVLNEVAVAELDKRASIGDTLLNTVDTLRTAVQGNLNVLNQTVASVSGNVQASVVVAIKANLNAIANALKAAVDNIIATTGGGVLVTLAGLQGLTGEQLSKIVAGLQQLIALLQQIRATLVLTVSDISPSVKASIAAELAAVQNAINPFIGPLQVLIQALAGVQASGRVTITGLNELVTGAVTFIIQFLQGLIPLPL